MLGITAQVVDPTTYNASIYDFTYVGDSVEVQVLISNNLGKELRRFVVSATDENWKADLESQVRESIKKQDKREQVKIDIARNIVLDLSAPTKEDPPLTPEQIAQQNFTKAIQDWKLDKSKLTIGLPNTEPSTRAVVVDQYNNKPKNADFDKIISLSF